MGSTRENIKINWKKGRIHGSLCVFDFMDNGHHIAYMPSLNLTGYGDTKEEAHSLLMDYVLNDYLIGLFTLPQSKIIDELKKSGWDNSLFFTKDFSKSHVDGEGVLREFNLPAETKIGSQLMSVA
jgi:hypothetical protein